jgi:hypothetical protein
MTSEMQVHLGPVPGSGGRPVVQWKINHPSIDQRLASEATTVITLLVLDMERTNVQKVRPKSCVYNAST